MRSGWRESRRHGTGPGGDPTSQKLRHLPASAGGRQRFPSAPLKETLSGYSSTVVDHFRNPRNVGDLDDADAVALVREPRCGDILRLAARVRDGRITEVRFKASGCAAAVAVGSRLTQLLTGTEPESVLVLAAAEIAAAVDGLPAGRAHAADLGEAAVRQLVEQLRDLSDPEQGGHGSASPSRRQAGERSG